MREFSPEYLSRSRRGMWDDTRRALTDLRLDSRTRVLEVGCGTGEFTSVLREETDATLVGLDADRSLLAVARDRFRDESGDTDRSDADEPGEKADNTRSTDRPDASVAFLTGAAGRLPFPPDSFDLVVCQALLVNLPDPVSVVREFARVSSELVAAVEPVNGDVTVSSTVGSEAALESEARAAFIAGAETGVDGDGLREWFDAAGLAPAVRRYEHEKRVEPPYSEADLRGATRKATGASIADHERELRRGATDYDDLRRRWRAMGRQVVDQMRREDYRRVERVPFDVSVGRVGRD